MSLQGNLFDLSDRIELTDTIGPGTMNLAYQLVLDLNRAIKESGKHRAVIAAEMTRVLYREDEDKEITKSMIDSWTSQSKNLNRFPAEFLPAFVYVTGAYFIFERLAKPLCCTVLKGDAALAAQLGAAMLEQKQAEARRQKIESGIPENKRHTIINGVKGAI